MPTNIKKAELMTVGGAGGGKHWTKSEVESRQAAEEKTRRKKRPMLKPPAWLTPEALEVWKDLKKKLRDIELLDNLDAELLGMYCDAVVHYKEASGILNGAKEHGSLMMEEPSKTAQAWLRLVLQLSEKLGLTPGGRARLAKRRAEKQIDEFEDQFDK